MTDQTRQSFLQRISNLTRSATSLRARIRRAAGRSMPQVDTQVEEKTPAKVTRTSHAPEGQCIYAIGDVHGRCDLLEKLVEQIDEDSQSLPDGTKRVLVFLGDYIDRGLQSKDVIEFLLSDRLKVFERVFLMGNHEEALLRFLNEVSFGKQWVRYGGAETLYSYGLQPPQNARAAMQSHDAMQAYQRAWDKVWTEFRNRLPEHHLKFYQNLQHYYVTGDYLFVHAGLRPGEALENQTVRDMLWIREEFLDAEEQFPQVVVHGHTPADGVFRDDRRIGLDTGAFISGKLSAVRLYRDEVSFLST
ncbi:metallophosphoesterase family protein [Hyphomonas sp.]|uniref:metallophosphoesterase family protein n=1 Tax=Hyphomonas sp. TaxID=87 RepID=UPI003527800D